MQEAPNMQQNPPRKALERLPIQLVFAGLSGALLYGAFPLPDVGALAWVALVPLFMALTHVQRPGRAALAGFLFGAVFFGALLRYLGMWGSCIPWVAAVLYQSLYPLVFALVAWPALRQPSVPARVLGGAAAWTLVAWLRCNAGGLAFSFGDLAYSQHSQLPLIQVCSIAGQLGLTFLIALINSALAQALMSVLRQTGPQDPEGRRMWARHADLTAVCCYAVLMVIFLAGARVVNSHQGQESCSPNGRTLKVALVQGNVPLHTPVSDEDVEASKRVYLNLMDQVPSDTGLTLWPESALPAYMPDFPGLQETATEAARKTDGVLMLGTIEHLGARFYNAAELYDSNGKLLDRYHKMDLVVYGEYVPLRDKLAFLKRFPLRQNDLSAGKERKVFDIKGVRVAPLICFEGIFSRPGREVCRMGAEVIAILTSDAWAEGSFEVRQHSATAVFRAVEARRYVCRAAATGQTAIYDPYGNLLDEVPIGQQGVITGQVNALSELSVYHRLGDSPLLALCALMWLLSALPRVPRRLPPEE
jgi:apolipoprotein N-acyltransferase